MIKGFDSSEYGYITATKPWSSSYADVLNHQTDRLSDLFMDQKQIDMCLNCPYPECIECIDGWKTIRSIGYPPKKNKKARKHDSVRRTRKP